MRRQSLCEFVSVDIRDFHTTSCEFVNLVVPHIVRVPDPGVNHLSVSLSLYPSFCISLFLSLRVLLRMSTRLHRRLLTVRHKVSRSGVPMR